MKLRDVFMMIDSPSNMMYHVVSSDGVPCFTYPQNFGADLLFRYYDSIVLSFTAFDCGLGVPVLQFTVDA